jgi:hypothetical protein
MTRNDTTRRRAGALFAVVVLLGAVAAVPAAAVTDVSVTDLTNPTAEGGTTTSHVMTVTIENVSTDGTTDLVFVELPDEYANRTAFSTASFVNRTTNASVPISSSTSIVDGPDDDGVPDTLRTGLSHDADYGSDDVEGTYQFDLTHPDVESTTEYDVAVYVNDSDGSTATVVSTGAITVEPGDDTDGTATDGMDGGDGTDTDGTNGDGTATDDGDGTNGGDGTDTDDGGTSGNTPGFTVAIALLVLILLAGVVYLRQ